MTVAKSVLTEAERLNLLMMSADRERLRNLHLKGNDAKFAETAVLMARIRINETETKKEHPDHELILKRLADYAKKIPSKKLNAIKNMLRQTFPYSFIFPVSGD